MTENTRDLMAFGYVELKEAARLLHALKTINDETKNLGDNVALEFNPRSGNVFLVDEDFNVAMMNGNTLENWYFCPECGNEGFDCDKHSMQNDQFVKFNGYCSQECENKNK